MAFIIEARWGDLHAGDVVRGRDGKAWTITKRELETKHGSGWLSRAGDRHDIFALRCEDGREIEAGRPIGEVVPLLTRADRSEINSACDALAAAGLDVQIIREGSSVTAPGNPCQHPGDQLSTLKDGRVFCTACFETVHDPGKPETDVAPHPPQCTCPRPECVALFVGVPAQDYAAPASVAAFEAHAELSAPVATVVVVNEPAPAPAQTNVFEFDDPAARPTPEESLIKNKRYWLPHPETGVMTSFTRASTLAKVLASDFLLHQWELREVAYGIAISPDLIALAASVIRDEDPAHIADTRSTLTEVVKKAKARAKMDARANLGTALHGFTHRSARGETIEQMHVPEALRADLNAYKHSLRMHGLTEIPDLVERTMVSLKLGVAGTFDRVVHQRPTLTNPYPVPYSILDLKTGKSLDFSMLEFAVQFAIYANGDYLYDRASKTWVPFPGPDVLDRDRALLLHLPVGMASPTLWAVDIHKGWKLAQTSEDGRQARNNAKGFGWLIEPDPETLLIHRVSKATSDELAKLWERHFPAGEWSDAVNQAALDRAAELMAVPA